MTREDNQINDKQGGRNEDVNRRVMDEKRREEEDWWMDGCSCLAGLGLGIRMTSSSSASGLRLLQNQIPFYPSAVQFCFNAYQNTHQWIFFSSSFLDYLCIKLLILM